MFIIYTIHTFHQSAKVRQCVVKTQESLTGAVSVSSSPLFLLAFSRGKPVPVREKAVQQPADGRGFAPRESQQEQGTWTHRDCTSKRLLGLHAKLPCFFSPEYGSVFV